MTKTLTLEQLLNTSFDKLISLYQQGYRLSENPELYPNIDDVLPYSRSDYQFASTKMKLTTKTFH